MGIFVSDARVGVLAQLRVTGCLRSFAVSLRGGVPPLRRWGALRTEPPLRVTASAATWSRYAGECPLCGAPTTIDTGALRTEPPLRVTASGASWSRYAGSFVSEDA